MPTISNRLHAFWSAQRHWIGWFLLTVFCVFQFSLQGIISILATSIKQSFDIDAKGLSLLSSSFYYSYLLVQIPVGFIFDRFGVRKVSSSALSLIAVSCILFALATSVPFAIAARILMGFGSAFAFIGLVVATGRWFGPKLFPLLMALCEFIAMCGVSGANALFSRMVVAYNWRAVMYLCGSIAFVIAIAILTFSKREENFEGANRVPLIDALKIVVRSKAVWFGGLYAFAVFSVVTSFAGLWAIPFFMNTTHMDLVSASSAVSMIFVGIATGSPFIGRLAISVRVATLMFCGAVGTLCFMLLILYGPKSPSTVGFMMFGLGIFATVYQIPFVLINRVLSPSIQGVAMGMTNMITMLSGPLLQPLIAFILVGVSGTSVVGVETYTSEAFHAALTIIPVCLAASAILALNLRSYK